jgi:hypothetical protein
MAEVKIEEWERKAEREIVADLIHESAPCIKWEMRPDRWAEIIARAYTESGQDEYRRGWDDCILANPLYPLYQEYASMVPPKGQAQMTFIGWLRSLAAKIRCERDTPKSAERSHAGQEEGQPK